MQLNLNNKTESFLLFFKFVKSDFDLLLGVSSSLGSSKSGLLEGLLGVSLDILFGLFLGEYWGFSDFSVDFFIKLSN